MIITLLAWIYITLLCYMWGNLLLRSMGIEPRSIHFSITCLTGFAGITIFCSLLTFFIPLGTWIVQVILLVIPLLLLKWSWLKWNTTLKEFNQLTLILFACCLLMILVMSTWTIIHPDTLGYHAQTINWISDHKAVPGLVNLHVRFGYQGLWFVAGAVFGFKFLGLDAVTFINSTILAWYFFFLFSKINENTRNPQPSSKALVWLILLAYSIWNYTQVRLTATSASPDFIATLLILAIIYIMVEAENYLLLILLAVFAITIKLSAIPLVVVIVYAIIKMASVSKAKHFAWVMLLSLLATGAFVGRNIITSGYAVFPSTAIDIADVDWKFPAFQTNIEKDYITAYARIQSGENPVDINKALHAPVSDWLPVWWQQRSFAQKTLLIVTLISFLVSLGIFNLLKGWRRLAWVTAVAGIVFWFIQAPDPRFGDGFLLTLPIIVLSRLHIRSFNNRNIVALSLFLISLLLLVYTGYRIINFFRVEQIISPLGIENSSHTTVNCSGINFVIPQNGEPCSDLKVPCVYDECTTFEPRGTSIEYGFRKK